jgi:NAD(P)H-dependent FMN reductase
MQNGNRLRLAVIIGSTRKGRVALSVARWFAGIVEQREDMAVHTIDLAEAPLPCVLDDERPPEAAALSTRLVNAEAFVIVTPEYNRSFPAPLKNAIDWHSKEWKAKPVGFVSYGGNSGGLRAVEQLRQVFAELHAVTVRNTVSFHHVWNHFNSEGPPRNIEKSEAAAKSMLDQLAWWAQALREAKLTRPYKF